jgi:cell wall assembly regulator SMI1
MRLVEEWARLRKWLREYAPQTDDFLLAGAKADDTARFERATGFAFPEELHQWWLCCNGTRKDDLAEVIPPFYTPSTVTAARQSWERHCLPDKENRQSPMLPRDPALVPFAHDGCGGELVVDLRGGAPAGAVREWNNEAGEVSEPVWPSMAGMLKAINDSLYAGEPVVHCIPKVTLWGRLDWRIC